jgi:Tetraspanin family
MLSAYLPSILAWAQADVMYVADYDLLVLITLSGCILLFVALMGTTGALLNSRPILAVYTLLLWPAFISMLAIGYISYRRATFSLDRKLNLAWSQYYTPLGRLLIQDSLRCCGFYDALHDATSSKQCYSRTSLPGCKGNLYNFERDNLALIWSTTFSLVPLHILNIAVALLTANHMTNGFGKGITPKRYRLCGSDVKMDADRLFGPVAKPDISRVSSSRLLREDREDRRLLEGEIES